jgi:hypothetical protein
MSKLAQSFFSWKEKNCICQKKGINFVKTKLNSNEYIEWQMSYAIWIELNLISFEFKFLKFQTYWMEFIFS